MEHRCRYSDSNVPSVPQRPRITREKFARKGGICGDLVVFPQWGFVALCSHDARMDRTTSAGGDALDQILSRQIDVIARHQALAAGVTPAPCVIASGSGVHGAA
jgi:hypothetical protein